MSTGALSGNLIGPLVGGFLPEFVGIRGTFFVGGGMIAVAALTTLLFVREDFGTGHRTPDNATGKTGLRVPVRNGRSSLHCS